MSLINLLHANSIGAFDAEKESARAELEPVFPSAHWGVEIDCSEYSVENKDNLWRNELRKPIRNQFDAKGFSKDDYTTWLEDVHFTHVAIYPKNVFEQYKSNIGWRVTILAMPRAGVIAIGIASHYQGGQRHAQLGLASNLLFDAAKDGLAGSETGVTLPGRKVNADDWDRDGLILEPVYQIAGLDLATVPNIDHLILKDIRTTTVKKSSPLSLQLSHFQSQFLKNR